MKIILLFMFVLALQVSTMPHCDEQRMRQLARDSDLIVVAEIVEVGRAGGTWSGLILNAQFVRYKVKDVLKGKLVEPEINVGHYIVKDSLTADTKKPRLSPEIFKKGNRFALFLAPDPGKGKYVSFSAPDSQAKAYVVPEVNCGAILADESTVNMLQRLITAK